MVNGKAVNSVEGSLDIEGKLEKVAEQVRRVEQLSLCACSLAAKFHGKSSSEERVPGVKESQISLHSVIDGILYDLQEAAERLDLALSACHNSLGSWGDSPRASTPSRG